MRIINLVLLLILVSNFCGCYWAGKVTGKAVKKVQTVPEKIKKIPEEFKKGYEDGIK